MTAGNVIVQILILFMAPLLSMHYLKGGSFSSRLRARMTLGGLAWIMYSWFSLELSEYVLGVAPADSPLNEWFGLQIADLMINGEWGEVWKQFTFGNTAYHTYLALLNYLFGITEAGAVTINAMLGFWPIAHSPKVC